MIDFIYLNLNSFWGMYVFVREDVLLLMLKQMMLLNIFDDFMLL